MLIGAIFPRGVWPVGHVVWLLRMCGNRKVENVIAFSILELPALQVVVSSPKEPLSTTNDFSSLTNDLCVYCMVTVSHL